MLLVRALAGFHYQEALMVLNQTVISDFQLELEGVKRLINSLSIIFPFKITLESKRLRQGACFKHRFAPWLVHLRPRVSFPFGGVIEGFSL